MGGDGGTKVLSRSILVKRKQEKVRAKDASYGESIITNWTTCAISQEPLRKPVVCDDLGYLMNKSALIEALLSRALDTQFSHIRSLKDVHACNLTYSEESKQSDRGDDDDSVPKIFSCPIVMLPANGKTRFVSIRACGCVLSERAIKAVSSDMCLVCGKPFDCAESARIVLNPSVEERDRMRESMLARRATEPPPKEKKKKKHKKRKRRENDGSNIHESKKQKSNAYASLFNKTEIGGGHSDIPEYNRLMR